MSDHVIFWRVGGGAILRNYFSIARDCIPFDPWAELDGRRCIDTFDWLERKAWNERDRLNAKIRSTPRWERDERQIREMGIPVRVCLNLASHAHEYPDATWSIRWADAARYREAATIA